MREIASGKSRIDIAVSYSIANSTHQSLEEVGISFVFVLKGYVKSANKWYHSIMVLWLYYMLTYVAWGIFFYEMSVSLDSCMTGLWFSVNKKNVFKESDIIRSSQKRFA